MNPLHLNPCIRVCFSGDPNLDIFQSGHAHNPRHCPCVIISDFRGPRPRSFPGYHLTLLDSFWPCWSLPCSQNTFFTWAMRPCFLVDLLNWLMLSHTFASFFSSSCPQHPQPRKSAKMYRKETIHTSNRVVVNFLWFIGWGGEVTVYRGPDMCQALCIVNLFDPEEQLINKGAMYYHMQKRTKKCRYVECLGQGHPRMALGFEPWDVPLLPLYRDSYSPRQLRIKKTLSTFPHPLPCLMDALFPPA